MVSACSVNNASATTMSFFNWLQAFSGGPSGWPFSPITGAFTLAGLMSAMAGVSLEREAVGRGTLPRVEMVAGEVEGSKE
jgi:hypothetical protein